MTSKKKPDTKPDNTTPKSTPPKKNIPPKNIPPATDASDTEPELAGDFDAGVVPFRYSITSYGADYPVDSLVKRLSEKAIFIPDFQREYVWKIAEASRFIESLLLGLPVPGIFLARDPKTKALLVIDGQQRLKTLEYFYKGKFEDEKPFKLRQVQAQFEGKSYEDLSLEDKRILSDTILHATIIRQDSPSDDQSSIYHIFERLNTGGRQLFPQEIRACIFHGPFNDLLNDLNKDSDWRNLYGKVSSRLKDRELILRFFALFYNLPNYARPMKEFLNDFMGKHRNLDTGLNTKKLENLFKHTCQTINEAIGPAAIRPESVLNVAVFDAVFVGIARRLVQGPITDKAELAKRHAALLKEKNFVDAYSKSTADESSVHRRIELATATFKQIP